MEPARRAREIEYWHLRWYRRHVRLPWKRDFPPGLRPFGGGAYWCLSRECVEYVAEFARARRDVVEFFKHVDIPDEIFFQTVVMNSDLAGSVVNDNLRYIDWSRGPRPAILEARDFEGLRDSRKLFARKFDVSQDVDVLDLIATCCGYEADSEADAPCASTAEEERRRSIMRHSFAWSCGMASALASFMHHLARLRAPAPAAMR